MMTKDVKGFVLDFGLGALVGWALAFMLLSSGCDPDGGGTGDGGADAGAAEVRRDAAADASPGPGSCFAVDPSPATVEVVPCPGAPDGGAAACTYREPQPNGSVLTVSGCSWGGRACVASCGGGG